jgi:acetyltransferase-like isoleucine patch superfamily enzyme
MPQQKWNAARGLSALPEIQKGAVIGARTRVQSHAFICELVTIGEGRFVGHGVMFIKDSFFSGGPSGGRKEL